MFPSIIPNIPNQFSAAKDLVERDAGHALNLATNLVTKGSMHGGGNPVGNALVADAHADPNNPSTIVNLSGQPVSAPATAPPKNPPVLGASTTTPASTPATTSSGTSSSTAPLVSEAQTALQQALDALNSSNTTVNAEEAQQEKALDSQQGQQESNYNQTLTTNAQQLADAIQSAKTQGHSDITSLMRMIAAMGGGGSSVETELVPKLVEQSVAGNISGANTTKAQNDRSAATAWNTFLNNLGTQRQQLHDQVSQQLATNQGSYNRSKATLDQILANLASGTGSPSDLQYELQSAEGQIPNVVNWTPSFSGETPVYTPPSLSTYELTPSQIAANAGQSAPVSGASVIPFLASLTQQQKQNSNTPALVVATS